MNMKTLSYSDAPKDWAVCMQADCPMADSCLRRSVALMMPASVKERLCVMPSARKGDKCKLFATNQPVRLAWGMTRLFEHVRWQDKRAMRQDLIAIFGERMRYYRFRKGRWPLSPDMQAAIARVMKDYGYAEEPRFDHTELCYYFPDRTSRMAHLRAKKSIISDTDK